MDIVSLLQGSRGRRTSADFAAWINDLKSAQEEARGQLAEVEAAYSTAILDAPERIDKLHGEVEKLERDIKILGIALGRAGERKAELDEAERDAALGEARIGAMSKQNEIIEAYRTLQGRLGAISEVVARIVDLKKENDVFNGHALQMERPNARLKNPLVPPGVAGLGQSVRLLLNTRFDDGRAIEAIASGCWLDADVAGVDYTEPAIDEAQAS
jgi:hypothetical protein